MKKIHVERRVLLQAYTGAIINYQLLIFTPGSSIHTVDRNKFDPSLPDSFALTKDVLAESPPSSLGSIPPATLASGASSQNASPNLKKASLFSQKRRVTLHCSENYPTFTEANESGKDGSNLLRSTSVY